MEKDRERRYASADLLAQDIERFLSGDTVLAGPPTLSYRMSKMLRRYKYALTFAGAVLLLLIGGVIATSRQAHRAQIAEKNAIQEGPNRQNRARKIRSGQRLARTLVDEHRSDQSQTMDTTLLLSILEQAATDVEGSSPAPLVEASIRRVLGGAFQALARFDDAEHHLERAYELRSQELEPTHADYLESHEDLGILYVQWGPL